MPAEIRVVHMRAKANFTDTLVINPCSNSLQSWQSDLSPFLLGPCKLYGDYVSENMENAWQFAKVYKDHAEKDGSPTPAYWSWANRGWKDRKAHRYPMGRGARPLHSLWDGQHLGYIDARKAIYGPLYSRAVVDTPGYAELRRLHQEHQGTLVLRDFDGYDHVKLGMSLTEVLNNPKRKMGHAFVLAMLLLDDPALKQFEETKVG